MIAPYKVHLTGRACLKGFFICLFWAVVVAAFVFWSLAL